MQKIQAHGDTQNNDLIQLLRVIIKQQKKKQQKQKTIEGFENAENTDTNDNTKKADNTANIGKRDGYGLVTTGLQTYKGVSSIDVDKGIQKTVIHIDSQYRNFVKYPNSNSFR